MKPKLLCVLAALLCNVSFAAAPPAKPLSQAQRIVQLEARVAALEAKLKPPAPVAALPADPAARRAALADRRTAKPTTK